MYIKNDFIFLHVPKTAGTAMKHHLRKHHYSHYYDDETRSLIAEKEKFIIDRFGYKFEQQ